MKTSLKSILVLLASLYLLGTVLWPLAPCLLLGWIIWATNGFRNLSR